MRDTVIKTWWHVIIYNSEGGAECFGFSSIDGVIMNTPVQILGFRKKELSYRHFKQWLVERKAKVYKCAEEIIYLK